MKWIAAMAIALQLSLCFAQCDELLMDYPFRDQLAEGLSRELAVEVSSRNKDDILRIELIQDLSDYSSSELSFKQLEALGANERVVNELNSQFAEVLNSTPNDSRIPQILSYDFHKADETTSFKDDSTSIFISTIIEVRREYLEVVLREAYRLFETSNKKSHLLKMGLAK